MVWDATVGYGVLIDSHKLIELGQDCWQGSSEEGATDFFNYNLDDGVGKHAPMTSEDYQQTLEFGGCGFYSFCIQTRVPRLFPRPQL